MKKFALLLISVLTFVSCDTDDDGPNVNYELAEITDHNLPEFIEPGEDYDIDITYELPDACHTFAGFDQGGAEDEDDEDIFVYYIHAITSYDPNLAECDEEGELTETKTARENFNVSSDSQYTTIQFKLLTGVSSTNEREYITVDVPVGAPDDSEEEDTGDENSN
ncbi:hypothetical protein [Autumnicola psychrophila]|uniref:Lipoprotein n=1 Tax=Autumnicola psychrophila TaxID=3075592 RepID=A0ABU3DP29_9FLAO|nr:hypothetical protein [Zunongwangia sp. F225]MDT0685466.1 hypothetical protein [Zunongwangia sp. F225]